MTFEEQIRFFTDQFEPGGQLTILRDPTLREDDPDHWYVSTQGQFVQVGAGPTIEAALDDLIEHWRGLP